MMRLHTLSPIPMTRWAKVAIVFVVAHGVVQYLLINLRTLTSLRAGLLLCAVAVFLTLALHDELRRRVPPAWYLLVQNALGLALPWIGAGYTAMAALPVLTLNGLVLPGQWVVAPAALHTVNVLCACAVCLPDDLRPQFIYIFLVAVVFVLAFTQALASEVRLREKLDVASQQLAAQAAQAEEMATLAERERVARELHDSLGHALTAAHVHLQVAERHAIEHPERAKTAIVCAREVVRTGLDDLRETVRTLKTPASEPLDLRAALQRLVRTHHTETLHVTVNLHNVSQTMPSHMSLALYRVAQEALTNVIKHAHASEASITLSANDGKWCLRVQDNGHGLPANYREGFGLTGIRERLSELGGRLTLDVDAGTRLIAEIPLANRGA
jgi:signal transduction histidine kinase